MTLHKLKVAALQHEQREDWTAALALYRQAIRESEGGPESGDPSLYNRVGDLELKAGNDAGACDAWEQAVGRYGELGFLNSAIALCGKMLRVNPQRTQTFLELARLNARKRVLYDVRQNLEIYLEQMSVAGKRDAARTAAQQLGDEFPGWRDLDALLDELLGREPASDAVTAVVSGAVEPARGLVYLDTAPITIERTPEDLVAPSGADAVEHSEPGASFPSHVVDGLISVEQTAHDLPSLAPLEGFDTHLASPTDRAPATPRDRSDMADHDDTSSWSRSGDLVYLPTDDAELPGTGEEGGGAGGEGGASGLPDDALGLRVRGHDLIDHGDRAAGIARLERSLAQYQGDGEWLHACRTAGELVAAEPNSIPRHQVRVEMAARLRDPGELCAAYADLGDALLRAGNDEKAVAVYRRVLELDEGNAHARRALAAMNPAAPVDSEFVDLGAMLIDDHPRSTRMRTEAPEVDADEDETFRDALAEFKRALDQNLPVEDHQAHYDLGIAFKEMGLLNEAVSEFQKALRAPEGRLRTSEALGEVFFEQGKSAVAEAVLRGVEGAPEGDAEKIGVLYWLGRSIEAQGRRDEALRYYQRVTAVDVEFRDVTDRLAGTQNGAGG